MAGNCRDCKRCTESSFKRMLAGPFRLLAAPAARTARMLKKKCRQCGHPLDWHQKIDGRFAD